MPLPETESTKSTYVVEKRILFFMFVLDAFVLLLIDTVFRVMNTSDVMKRRAQVMGENKMILGNDREDSK